MNLVSDSQWSGWFSGMGDGGVILQNVITAVTPFLIGGLAIYFAFLIFKTGTHFSKADGPEQRKEAKHKLMWLVLGLLVTLIGPTLLLILMNTTFKTVQTGGSKAPAGATAAVAKDLQQIITLRIPNLNL